MKRKSLLFFLLMAMFAPLAMNGQQALPYSYGFENNNLATDGWIANVTSTSSGINSAAAYSGSYGFRFQYSERSGSLISPVLTGGDRGVDVSFWYKEYSSSYGDEQFYVGYTTDANTTDVDAFTYGSIITASTSWQKYTNSFPAGTKRIAIKYVYNYAFYLYLDDFTFEATSNCAKPTNFAVNYEGGTTAIVTWEGDASSYNIDVNGTVTSDVSSPYTLSNLEPATSYTVMVQADCGSEQSGWTNAESFFTDCEAFDLPYAYGFETDDINCWTGGSMNTDNSIGITNQIAHDGSKSFLFSSYSSASDYNQYLISPELNTTSAILVSFYYNRPSSSGSESFKVGYSTTTNDISAFTWEYDIVETTVTDWTLFEETMPAGTKYVAVNYYSNFQYYLVVDDFNFISTACGTPIDLTAEVTGNAAELSWTGTTETYNLQYCEVDPTVPATIILNIPSDVWGDDSGYQMLIDADATAYGTIIPETGGLTSSGDASAATYAEFEYKLPTNADGSCTTSNILVEGSLSIEIPAGTYDWCITNPTPGDRIWIASSNGNVNGRQDDYVFEPGMTYEFTIYVSGNNDAVDVTITDNNAWTLVEGVNNPYTLENLSSQTTYKYQVQGVDCDGNGSNTGWSASATFTTGEFYIKPIAGWSNAEPGASNFYLIASPIGNVDPRAVTIQGDATANMVSGSYDLYYFDHNRDLEWVNYKKADGTPGAFNTLVSGKGYLYANLNNVTLVFTGTGITSGTKIVALDYYEEGDGFTIDLPGWNLLGNPFAKTAYLTTSESSITTNFYTMDAYGIYLPVTNGSIDAMEGVFVHAEGEGQSVTFTTNAPSKSPVLNLNLSNGRRVVDRAIVRFDRGNQLPKLQFREGSTKVYIPVEGQDYAVVSCEEMGELPVSFKAEENGSYNLSLSSEEVSFAYLHLIDNMTGADVDLLQTPSYSFEAKTTDYESRFKLVFATGDNSNDDNFAFFSNGSFVINNDGEATLQVIDVTGRILSSESINGCTNVNVNAASGVYMLRLINGDNVKVQKVVVK